MSTQTNLLPNEIYALQCLERYRQDDVVVDKTNGEFCHCPYPKAMGDSGYYLTHHDHMVQGILQSKDVDRCCFHVGETHLWLTSGEFSHHDWFILWDIFAHYATLHGRYAASLKSSANAGKRTFELQTGIWGMSDEDRFKARSLGAKNQMKNKVGIYAPGQHGRGFRQKWISTIDAYVSCASAVVGHNRKLGQDPNARILADTLEAPPHTWTCSL